MTAKSPNTPKKTGTRQAPPKASPAAGAAGTPAAGVPAPVAVRPPRWTNRQRVLVQKFVTEAAARLRLADWTVIFDFDDSAGEDKFATMTPFEGQKRAIMAFGPGFLTSDANNQRQTLVHELLHCHLFEMHFAHEHVLSQIPNDGVQKLARDVFDDRIEYVVDGIADAFVPLVRDLEVPAPDPR